MHYIIGDIHNENAKLKDILATINLQKDDRLYILGDLFDRGGADADPVGVYETILSLKKRCKVVRGNHDDWLMQYIDKYALESSAKIKQPYFYNSYELLRKTMDSKKLKEVSDFIRGMPYQIELTLENDDNHYLLAHAMTENPKIKNDAWHFLMGDFETTNFVDDGIEGYISICGHNITKEFSNFDGKYLDEQGKSIWCNGKGNVYMVDCGSGFEGGRLACMCLETKERYYST